VWSSIIQNKYYSTATSSLVSPSGLPLIELESLTVALIEKDPVDTKQSVMLASQDVSTVSDDRPIASMVPSAITCSLGVRLIARVNCGEPASAVVRVTRMYK